MGFCDVGSSPPSPAQRRHRASVRSQWYQSNPSPYPLVTVILYAWVGLYPCQYPSLSRWLTFYWLFDRPASSGCFPRNLRFFWVGGSYRTGTPGAAPLTGIDREPHLYPRSIFRTRLCEANLIVGPI
jgi:hypothetical protein